MRITNALWVTLLVALTAYAQRQTGLTPELLRDLQQSCPADAHFTSARKALTQVDGKKLSLDWQKLTSVDEHFSNKLTDQSYHDAVKDVLDDYLALYSIPTLPFDRKYRIELDKAVEDRPDIFFVNCSLEPLKQLSKTVLLDNQPVWFGCDVGQESSTENGLMARDQRLCLALRYGLSALAQRPV